MPVCDKTSKSKPANNAKVCDTQALLVRHSKPRQTHKTINPHSRCHYSCPHRCESLRWFTDKSKEACSGCGRICGHFRRTCWSRRWSSDQSHHRKCLQVRVSFCCAYEPAHQHDVVSMVLLNLRNTNFCHLAEEQQLSLSSRSGVPSDVCPDRNQCPMLCWCCTTSSASSAIFMQTYIPME